MTSVKWAYYNEFDAKKAAWLRELIKRGVITDGEVDERPIQSVQPDDLRGFGRVHMFAGIGAWDYALNLAGWGDAEVWTGSAPCQPFSAAGKRQGQSDERHLWPEWFRLIDACKPRVVFGEQVASADAVGRSLGSPEEVQEMLDRSAVFGVLRELERQLLVDLPELHQAELASLQARSHRGDETGLFGVAAAEARACACAGGEVPGETKGLAVRSGCSPDTERDRRRRMRVDRHTVQPGRAEGVECSLVGSDHAGCRIHDEQHPRGSVCRECHGEHMGTAADHPNRRRHQAAENRRFKLLVEKTRRAIEGDDGPPWFDVVHSDLERARYTVGASVTASAGFGSPNIRQRLFFVAESADKRHERSGSARRRRDGLADDGATVIVGHPARDEQWRTPESGLHRQGEQARGSGSARIMADADEARSQGRSERGDGAGERAAGPRGVAGGLEVAERDRRDGPLQPSEWQAVSGALDASAVGPVNGFWRDAEWVWCRDEKWRPTEPGTFPLATGAPARVLRLRGYGDAINGEVAAAFIRAYYATRRHEPAWHPGIGWCVDTGTALIQGATPERARMRAAEMLAGGGAE